MVHFLTRFSIKSLLSQVLRWVGLLAVLCFSSMLFGQQGALRFRHLTIEHGLSQSTISAIHQDRIGFIWFATQDGLNRFDGYSIDVYKHEPGNAISLPENDVRAICEDQNGNMWLGMGDGSIARFDPNLDAFFPYRLMAPGLNMPSFSISGMVQGRHGFLWIATFGAGLFQFDPVSGTVVRVLRHDPNVSDSPREDNLNTIFMDRANRLWLGYEKEGVSCLFLDSGKMRHYRHSPLDTDSLAGNHVRAICEDPNGSLWFGCFGNGISRLDEEEGVFVNFRHGPGNKHALSDNWVKSLLPTRSGKLWVGTANAGICMLDLARETFVPYRHNPGDPFSLAFDDIRALFQSRDGMIWVGTSSAGCDRFIPPGPGSFHHVKSQQDEPGSLSNNMVTSMLVDHEQTLWIGSLGGGLSVLDEESGLFSSYTTDEKPGSIAHNWVMEIFEDRQNRLWIGSHGGLDLFDRETKRFTNFVGDESLGTQISHKDVYEIFQDSRERLWIGTQFGGLNLFDPETNSFQRIPYGSQPGALSHYNVNVIYEDGLGQLWVGTMGGLNRTSLDREPYFQTYRYNPFEPESLPHNYVRSISGDPNDRANTLWIGTGGGLARMDTSNGRFFVYREDDGLPNETIYAILPDARGFLWLSTNKGLSRFDPRGETFTNFDVSDGLQSNEFNQDCATRDEQGRLYFGGVGGYNRFHPEQMLADRSNPPIAITEFRLDNEKIMPDSEKEDSPLKQSILSTERLVLDYRNNDFSFLFATLQYHAPEKTKYAYKLDGFNNDWVFSSANDRRAAYTNIDPGHYSFRVKGTNQGNVWSNQQRSIEIVIQPPPWQTWWAITLYVIALSLLIFSYIRRQQHKLQQERHLNDRLRAIDRLKDDFLANTSHELRTPLNGIIGLAESMIAGAAGDINERVARNLQMVADSGRRLANLVNDILDFSKLKNHDITLRPISLHLEQVAEPVIHLLQPLVGNKDVAIRMAVDSNLPLVFADTDRLQQILYNLMGNSVKFTDRGYIELRASVVGQRVSITIEDTGCGIPKDQFERIFESFDRGSNALVKGGTGLGLALTRHLVKLHGSDIEVHSQLGEGSSFSFDLPISKDQSEPAPFERTRNRLLQVRNHGVDVVPTIIQPGLETATGPFSILIVDDEPVNRQVLYNFLTPLAYELVMVENGEAALDAISRQSFDMVLLDIMMPGLDGYQVCRSIRLKHAAYELPVLLLSARNQLRDLAEAYNAGANDYIVKPISREELLARVSTQLRLLEARRSLDETVVRRTEELKARNAELLGWDSIVRTINRDIEIDDVLQTMTDQGIKLFPQTQIGSFFLWFERENCFRVVAATGYELDMVKQQSISRQEVLRRYLQTDSEDEALLNQPRVLCNPGVFHSFSDHPTPASILCIPMVLGGRLQGFLVLSNLDDMDAFAEVDMSMVKRFREHGISALAKARIMEALQDKNRELIHTQQQMIMQEKMASLGTLTAGVAHEINNPTGFAHGSAQNLLVDLDKFKDFLFEIAGDDADSDIMADLNQRLAGLDHHVHTIKEGTSRIKGIVKSLQTFARADEGEVKWAKVSEGIATTLALVQTQYHDKVTFEEHYESPLDMECRPTALNQVFLNLIINGCQAILEKAGDCEEDLGQPLGTLSVRTWEEGDIGMIIIRDTGAGMSEAVRTRIFEPFFTTKPVGKGTGLGLSMSYGIIEKHGGRIDVDSVLGEGTTFTLQLPIKRLA